LKVCLYLTNYEDRVGLSWPVRNRQQTIRHSLLFYFKFT
jgi:hypothetical protein